MQTNIFRYHVASVLYHLSRAIMYCDVFLFLVVPQHVGQLHAHAVHGLFGQLAEISETNTAIPIKEIFIVFIFTIRIFFNFVFFNDNCITKFKSELKQGIQE
jgi:hypothetical protein